MDKDIDKVCDFLKDKVNLGNHHGFISELWSRGLVRLCRRKRTLREIILETSQGYPVGEWKKRCRESDIITQINALCDYVYIPIDEDLLDIPFSFIGMWIPKIVRVKISGWKDAMEKGVLKSYFGKFDIFEIADGESDKYVYDYTGDYFSYIRSFSLEARIRYYNTYFKLNHVNISIRNNSFDDPRYFYDVFLRQFAEYESILKTFDLEGKRLIFLGDGIGVGAIISEKNGWKYHSVERGGIGNLGVKIGLINSTNLPDKRESGDILVLMNVEEYLNCYEINDYDRDYDQIIVVAENRDSRIGVASPNVGMKVFLKGIDPVSEIRVRPISVTSDYLRSREPVMPLDLKSAIYSVENKIKISDSGFPISSKNAEGSFNIRTRAYPGNMKLHVKEILRYIRMLNLSMTAPVK